MGGIKDMGGLPDVVLFVVDGDHERIAIKEANKLEFSCSLYRLILTVTQMVLIYLFLLRGTQFALFSFMLALLLMLF